MTTTKNPFVRLGQGVSLFPPRLHSLLRQITEAGSPADEFQCYCNFVESLAKYLSQLCNSEYKNRPAEQADEKLEAMLRGVSGNVSFGHYAQALRVFTERLETASFRIPELADVLRSREFPTEVIRQIKGFQIIRTGRSEFEVPPHRLRGYVDKHLPGPKALVKGRLDDFLSILVEFRNRGVAHQEEDGWFPRDKQMYSLVVDLLAPSVEALLEWRPLHHLLTDYEIVDVDPKDAWPIESGRACRVRKRRILSGLAPLGRSHLRLPREWTVRETYVGKRTKEPHELVAVVRSFDFPATIHSAEQLHRRYSRQYISLYLEHGLITPAQRENTLGALGRQLSISPADIQKLELAIQKAINDDSDEEGRREQTLTRLSELLGPEWRTIQGDVAVALETLNKRRHAHVFDLVNNSYMMSFEQIRAQTELNDFDLQSVLVELEQEGRVRRVGPGGADEVHHGHFKAQNLQRAEDLRAILSAVEAGVTAKRKYPGSFWDLIKLCEALLAEDGLALKPGELERIEEMFERPDRQVAEVSEGGEQTPLVLSVDGIELRAESVRDLFEKAWALLDKRGIDARSRLPFRLGRTRYLVNVEPVHANGTPFGVMCPVGDVYFEGNLRRDRALREVERFLRDLGALKPASEGRSLDSELGAEASEAASAEADTLVQRRLTISDIEGGGTLVVEGRTVKGFLGALIDVLVEHGAPIDSVLPVRAGRVKYFLAEEPYHADGQEFEDALERDGYFVNVGFTFDRALELSRDLCRQLGLRVEAPEEPEAEEKEEVALRVEVSDQVIEGKAVPAFLAAAVEHLWQRGLLSEEDIPLKVGRVRYLVAALPRHDHGREFIRPIEIDLGGQTYFIEANVTRRGALDMVRDILASKGET
ncbi:MAG: hypothetical protein AB1Z98_00375 [Nannocystaceae bacterium]